MYGGSSFSWCVVLMIWLVCSRVCWVCLLRLG